MLNDDDKSSIPFDSADCRPHSRHLLHPLNRPSPPRVVLYPPLSPAVHHQLL
jgi:hypothetical protein